MPNILKESEYLTDDSYGYGAYILSRAIGHAVIMDGLAPHDGLHPNLKARRVADAYGRLLADILPGKHMTSRRIVVLQDAADLAFA
jgi:hypothetical protein